VTIFIDDYHKVIEPMIGVIPHPFFIEAPWNIGIDFGIKKWKREDAEAEIDEILSG